MYKIKIITCIAPHKAHIFTSSKNIVQEYGITFRQFLGHCLQQKNPGYREHTVFATGAQQY